MVNAQIFQTRALAQTARVPYNTWKQILFRFFDLLEDTPSDKLALQFEHEVNQLWEKSPGNPPAIDVISTLGKLIGIDIQSEGNRSRQPESAIDELEQAMESARALINRLSHGSRSSSTTCRQTRKVLACYYRWSDWKRAIAALIRRTWLSLLKDIPM
jgi:hypothetical protein